MPCGTPRGLSMAELTAMSLKTIIEAAQVFQREIGGIFQAYTHLWEKHEGVQTKYQELESKYTSLVEKYANLKLCSTSNSQAQDSKYRKLFSEHEAQDSKYKKLLSEHELMCKDHQEMVSERDILRREVERVCKRRKVCTYGNGSRSRRDDDERLESDYTGDDIRVYDPLQLWIPEPNRSTGLLTQAKVLMPYEGTDTFRSSEFKDKVKNKLSRGKVATFNDLQLAVHAVKNAVTRFSREFIEKLTRISKEIAVSLLEGLRNETYFSRKQHVSTYALRSHIYQVLFKGFKGYRTESHLRVSGPFEPGSSTPLIANLFEYFTTGRVHSDPNFWTFCEERVHLFSKEFHLPLVMAHQHKATEATNFLEYVGGHWLASSFREACKAVWLLHMLVSACDPRATIFRVPTDAEVDESFMEAVVSEEDDHSLIRQVGFMIAPGFRLQDQVIRSEVYLARRKELEYKP